MGTSNRLTRAGAVIAAACLLATVMALSGIGRSRAATALKPIVPTEKVGKFAVGRSEGGSGVTGDGAAAYSIPLWVPPGRAGLQPSLSLQYNSRSGNGIVGVGWSLSGLPRITRCPRTFAQDGGAGPVTFADGDDGDRFCLDGERLVAVGGPDGEASAYGDDGTEYEPESDPRIKVVSLGHDALGPLAFKVYLSDGRILTLGGSGAANSRLDGQRAHITFTPTPQPTTASWAADYSGRVRFAWALERMQDRSGNALTVRYSLNVLPGFGYEELPKSIVYTSFRADPTMRPTRRVDFTYEPRPDQTVSYVGGLRLVQNQRLSRVDMRWTPVGRAAVALRSYRMHYRNDSTSKRSLLRSVQECDGKGTCLPPTSLDWSPGPQPTFADADTHIPVTTTPSGTPDQNPVVHVADLDGDGRDDIEYRDNGPGGGSSINCSLPAAAGSIGCRHVPLNCTPPGGGSNPQPDAPQPDGRVTDINGDSRADLIFLERDACIHNQPPEFRNSIYLNLPESTAIVTDPTEQFMSYTKAAYALDMNGDGLPELVSADSSAYRRNDRGTLGGQLPTGLAPNFSASDRTLAGNIDGSGRATLLVPGPSGFVAGATVALSLDRGRPRRTPETVLTERDGYARPILMDINGDGLSDWVSEGSGSGYLNVSINTGNGFAAPEQWPVPAPYSASPSVSPQFARSGPIYNPLADGGARVIDYNGDGLQDLLLLGGAPSPLHPANTLAVLVSTGSGFQPVSLPLGLPVGQEVNLPGNTPEARRGWLMSQVLDANGDGLDDFLQVVGNEFHVYTRLGTKSDLLIGVTDSLGARESFDYASSSDRTVYTPGGGCSYPQTCALRGIWMVSRHTVTAAGTPTRRDDVYRYADGRVDLTGRGWLGFGLRTETDQVTGAVSSLRFDNVTRVGGRYPCLDVPVVETTDVALAAGRRRRQTVSTACTVVRNHHGRTSFGYPAQRDIRDSEAPSGGALALIRRQQVTQHEDSYGDVTDARRVAYTVRSGQAIGPADVLDIKAEFDNFPGAWIIGQERRETDTSAVEGGRRVSRTAAYGYSADTGLPSIVETEPGARRATSGLNERVRFQRDRYGLVTRITALASGRRRVDRFTYDSADHTYLASQTNAVGQTTRLAYQSGLGVLTSFIDPNGLQTRFEYDGFGRVRLADNPGAADVTTHYRTTSAGQPLISTTVAGGMRLDLELDRFWREAARQWPGFDGAPVRSETEYDQAGRPTLITYPHKPTLTPHVERFTYDNLDRPLAVINPNGTSSTWTYRGLTVTAEDEVHQRRFVAQDALGRIASSTDFDGSHPLNTRFRYGPFGTEESVTGPDRTVTTMRYDRLGRLVRLHRPDAGTQITRYDGFGDVTSEVDANGLRARWQHDGLGRLLSLTTRDGTTTFVWDRAAHGIGLPASAHSPDGVRTTYRYDHLSRLAQHTTRVSGEDYAINLKYDQFGRPSLLAYPSVPHRGRFSVRYLYTPQGELKSIINAATASPYWTDVSHNAYGLPTQWRFGNGATTQRLYDDEGRIRFIQTRGPGAAAPLMQSLEYRHATNGDVLGRTDLLRNVDESFSYDSLDRLASWHLAGPVAPPQTTTYDYSSGGNLRKQTVVGSPGTSVVYGYGGPRGGPHAVTGTSSGGTHSAYRYDRAGDQVQASGRHIAYTAFHLPSSVTTSSGTTRFAYDALHVRVLKRTPNGNTTISVGDLYERRTVNGHRSDVFHVLAPQPVAQVTWPGAQPPKTLYLHADALGSVDTVSDSSAAIAQHVTYTPFGVRGTTSADLRRGFTAHNHDDDLALINMQGRMYDPALGRFLSADPILDTFDGAEIANPYSYAANNPLTYTDPTGLQTEGADEEDTGLSKDPERNPEFSAVSVTGYVPGKGGGAKSTATSPAGGGDPPARGDPSTPGASCPGTCGGGSDSASAGSVPKVADDNPGRRPDIPVNPNDLDHVPHMELRGRSEVFYPAGSGPGKTFIYIRCPTCHGENTGPKAGDVSRELTSDEQARLNRATRIGQGAIIGGGLLAGVGGVAGGVTTSGTLTIGPGGAAMSLAPSGVVIADQVTVVAVTGAGTIGLVAAMSGSPQDHHIATWYGAWAKVFEPMFKKAGLTLQSAENFVKLIEHAGPHPIQYHLWVKSELESATEGLSGPAYRAAFIKRLGEIAGQLQKEPGMIKPGGAWWIP